MKWEIDLSQMCISLPDKTKLITGGYRMRRREDEAVIRLRMSSADAHYAGGLVDGAKMLEIFGDVATELLIRNDGDEGLFVSYDDVEFTAPVHSGDYIEARGRITEEGNTSRAMEFNAYKVITATGEAEHPSARDVLDEPELVCHATGTCVVPAARQRREEK